MCEIKGWDGGNVVNTASRGDLIDVSVSSSLLHNAVAVCSGVQVACIELRFLEVSEYVMLTRQALRRAPSHRPRTSEHVDCYPTST